MPSWNDLINEVSALPDDQAKTQWFNDHQNKAIREVGERRGGRHVILYGSAFLQKPTVPAESLMITHEDLNGLMAVIYGMNCSRGLSLILHTPGGNPNAAESMVAYLRSKFDQLEVIVPTLAMSAGTMISLGADRIIMGRQSQLGPIDPQLGVGPGRTVSARAVVEQYERARDDILKDVKAAHVWAPITQSLGPSLLQEAQNALDYSESTVAKWLSEYMFHGLDESEKLGKIVAHHFNDASKHKSHGRRIDRSEARLNSVLVDDLEGDQSLQEAVLTVYHLMMIGFDQGISTKMLWSDTGLSWFKNFAPTPARS